MPVSWLKKVVLPAPLGPMSETIDPRGMVKSTSRLAISPPNRMVTFSACRSGPDVGGRVDGSRGLGHIVTTGLPVSSPASSAY